MENKKSKNNIKYKLKNVYAKIARSGKNEFESFEDFKAWSLENGYKPWKVLSLTDKDDSYNKENCDWVNDRRGSNTALPIEKDKTPDNVAKNIKVLASNANETMLMIRQMIDVTNALTENSLIDRKTGKLMLKDLDKALKIMSNCDINIDNLTISEE